MNPPRNSDGHTLKPILLFFCFTLLTSSCINRVPILPDNHIPSADVLELTRVPFFPQKTDQCGPAALATLLNASGVLLEPDALVPMVYLPGKKGTLQSELLAAGRRYGRIPYVIDPDLSAIIEALQAGHPVLVLQNLGLKVHPVYHYAVVVGIDAKKNRFILRSGREKRLFVDTAGFKKTWRRAESWGFILLKPGEMAARPDLNRYLREVAAMESIGRFFEAEKGYRAMLRQWPDYPAALFGLGNSLLRQDSYYQAERTYRRLLTIQPQNKAVLNNLAETMMKQERYREALTTINRAITIESENQNQNLTNICLKTRAEILGLIKD